MSFLAPRDASVRQITRDDLLGKPLVPSAYEVGAWPSFARRFATEATRIPLWREVRDQSVLCREYPPFALEREVTTRNLSKRDFLPTFDLSNVFRSRARKVRRLFVVPFDALPI